MSSANEFDRRRVDLNIDLGELEDEPEEFYAFCTVANVALGGHAGTEDTLRRALGRAGRAGVRVAAHPGYPDRAHFGRRPSTLSEPELRVALRGQFETFRDAVADSSFPDSLVKAHGELYHDVARSPALARLFVSVASEVLGEGTGFVGLANSALARLCAAEGRRFEREGFADRGVDAEGRLLPRGAPGALLARDEAARRALVLAESGAVETLCVHGDGEGALETARVVHAVLAERHWLRR